MVKVNKKQHTKNQTTPDLLNWYKEVFNKIQPFSDKKHLTN